MLNNNLVIIGGTIGIGLSAAKAFLEQGARLVTVGRDPNSCEEAQKILGEKAKVFSGDATREETAVGAIEECMSSFDGLYHVAGGSGRKLGDGPVDELTLEGWNKTIELNLTSLMLSNRAAIKAFLNYQKTGTILNMGSVLGFSPSPPVLRHSRLCGRQIGNHWV